MLLTVALLGCTILIALIVVLSLVQWTVHERSTDRDADEIEALLREHTARRVARECAGNPLLLETLSQDLFTCGASAQLQNRSRHPAGRLARLRRKQAETTE
jgi:hypothetical protein